MAVKKLSKVLPNNSKEDPKPKRNKGTTETGRWKKSSKKKKKKKKVEKQRG